MNLIRKNWESDFFKTSIWELEVNNDEINLEAIKQLEKGDLVEINLHSKQNHLIPRLEDFGFRLIDSRIIFSKIIDYKLISKNIRQYKSLRFDFDKKNIDEAKDLIFKFLVQNSEFVSRYKNLDFFNPDDCKKYYLEWINTSFKSDEFKIVNVYHKEKLIGILVNRFNSESNQLSGVITAINSKYKGLDLHRNMQYRLIEGISIEDLEVINTTQLSNLSVIKNHISDQKKLIEITNTFYYKV